MAPALDDNGNHLKLVEAFKHGQQAKADGHMRQRNSARVPRGQARTRGPVLEGRF